MSGIDPSCPAISQGRCANLALPISFLARNASLRLTRFAFREGFIMPYVLCSVSEGLRPSEVTVEVQDVDDRSEYLRVHREFVKQFENRQFLPIGIVGHDQVTDLFLIELPHEADSGANRLWVASSSLFDPQSPRRLAAK
jgi:hypothetical protein